MCEVRHRRVRGHVFFPLRFAAVLPCNAVKDCSRTCENNCLDMRLLGVLVCCPCPLCHRAPMPLPPLRPPAPPSTSKTPAAIRRLLLPGAWTHVLVRVIVKTHAAGRQVAPKIGTCSSGAGLLFGLLFVLIKNLWSFHINNNNNNPNNNPPQMCSFLSREHAARKSMGFARTQTITCPGS